MVCTANVCGSQLAAALLRAGLTGGPEVRSAGTHAAAPRAACPVSAARADPAGRADLGRHAARLLAAADVRAAGLVLGAARAHRSAAVALAPSAQRRSFTLAQAARLASWAMADGAATDPPADPAARPAWLAEELHAWRALAPRPQTPADDDLPDPHDPQARAGHDDVLDRLEREVAVLLDLLGVGRAAAQDVRR